MIQPIEALEGIEKFLKVPLRGTFKNFSGFYNSAKCCISFLETANTAAQNHEVAALSAATS